MFIHFESDNHRDMYTKYMYTMVPNDPQLQGRIAILAGDINTDTHPFKYVLDVLHEHALRFWYVLFVPGNHDFYGTFVDSYGDELRLRLRERKLDNVIVLNGSQREFSVDGVDFWGDTLWTDLHLGGHDVLYPFKIQSSMPCFSHIGVHDNSKEGYHYFLAEDMLRLNQEQVYDLKRFLNKETTNKKVVVTHFSPSMKSMDPKFRFHSMNDYFHNNLDWIIEEIGPDVWIHGHSHAAVDYYIGKTRILCNPVGYPKQFGRTGHLPLKEIEVR